MVFLCILETWAIIFLLLPSHTGCDGINKPQPSAYISATKTTESSSSSSSYLLGTTLQNIAVCT